MSGLLSAGGDVGCSAVCTHFESPLLSCLSQLLGLEGVSRQRVRKCSLTSGLKFSFDMLPGGQCGGKSEGRLVYILASSGVLEDGEEGKQT